MGPSWKFSLVLLTFSWLSNSSGEPQRADGMSNFFTSLSKAMAKAVPGRLVSKATIDGPRSHSQGFLRKSVSPGSLQYLPPSTDVVSFGLQYTPAVTPIANAENDVISLQTHDLRNANNSFIDETIPPSLQFLVDDVPPQSRSILAPLRILLLEVIPVLPKLITTSIDLFPRLPNVLPRMLRIMSPLQRFLPRVVALMPVFEGMINNVFPLLQILIPQAAELIPLLLPVIPSMIEFMDTVRPLLPALMDILPMFNSDAIITT